MLTHPNYTIINSSKENVKILTVNDVSYEVTNHSRTEKINEARLIEAYNAAQGVKNESLDAHGSLVGTINYTLITEENLYFYEETKDGSIKHMMIFDNFPQAILTPSDYAKEPVLNEELARTIPITNWPTPIANGITARLNINRPAATYQTCRVLTPTASQVTANNTTSYNYIYGGFSGSGIESDLGLQWTIKSPTGGWNHWFLVHKSGSYYYGTFDPSYNAVQASNYFLTSGSIGSNKYTINLTAYRDFNYTGKVRSKVEGYARYTNSAGTGTPGAYWLISVKEAAVTVGTLNKWKLVQDLTSPSGTTFPSGSKGWCEFSEMTTNNNPIDMAYLSIDIYKGTVIYSYMGANIDKLAFTMAN
jgi:hypothetical protein